MSTLHEQILSAVAGKRASVKGWVRGACPMCPLITGKEDRKSCLAVSARSGRYGCWKCGSRGKLPRFDPSDIDCSRDLGAQDDEGPQEISPPEGYIPLDGCMAQHSNACLPAYGYLMAPSATGGRGLSLEQIYDAGIGCCVSGCYHSRVIVPLLDDDGAWLWWIGRSWVKKAEKPYTYPSGNRTGLIYNHQAIFTETEEPCGVVEGAFDALALGRDTGCALLGKPTEEQIWALASARRPLAIVQDGDAHQLGLSLALRLRFEGCRSGNVVLPPGVDPDECDKQWLRQRMRECLDEP